jgi:hypothetical protein
MDTALDTPPQGLPPEERPGEPIASLQREVQRKLGRCMLRLQQYERLIKAIAVDVEIAGPVDEIDQAHRKRSQAYSRFTLGQLVNELTGSYLQPQLSEETQAQLGPEWEPDDPSRIWFCMQASMTMDPLEYAKVVSGLKELVRLRNELVHHFLERFDVWTVEGCAAADVHLDTSMRKVDAHYAELRQWALRMDEARKKMASFMATPAYIDFLFDGIYPDGSVNWPHCGIVRCLRAAAQTLANDGWASLEQAISWMRFEHPEQTLARYGCSSWRQVLHESKQFRIRREPGSLERAGRTQFQCLQSA